MTLLSLVLVAMALASSQASFRTRGAGLTLADFWIRDPNILYYDGTYYMTGTTDPGGGFLGYTSIDLATWTPIGRIYNRNASSSWALYDFWAPEQVYHDGKFYLFFSGKTGTTNRSTGVAVATSPTGPYVDLMADPLTPPEWNCLDGHLFVDDDGAHYFIYSHEWVDFPDGRGEFWIQHINENFTGLTGTKTYLFRGWDAQWSSGVTDGPSMLKQQGMYYLFWSSYDNDGGGYNCGFASSASPLGSYIQSFYPTITGDGGHSTWFQRGGTGELLVTYHQPNGGGQERAHIDCLCFSMGNWFLSKDVGVTIPAWAGIVPLAFLCLVGIVIVRKKARI